MWCGMGEGGVRVRVWAVADREGLRRVFGGASARVRVFNFNLSISLSAVRQMRGYDVAKENEDDNVAVSRTGTDFAEV